TGNPKAFSAASIDISPNVGCACTVNAKSSAFIPDSIAKPNSEIISEAPVPTTCAPTSVLYSLSVKNLTYPVVLSYNNARPLVELCDIEVVNYDLYSVD